MRLSEMEVIRLQWMNEGLQAIDSLLEVQEALLLTKAEVGVEVRGALEVGREACLLYTSPSPRDKRQSRMPSSA